MTGPHGSFADGEGDPPFSCAFRPGTSHAIFLALAATALGATAHVPKFSDFRTREVFTGPSAKPVLRTPVQKRFATQIRRQAAKPANFAGNYSVAEWGCGTSCVSIAIIDFKTGQVYDGPFSILGYGSPYHYEAGDDELEYRVSSRLIIARGCPEDKNCGTYYYEWKGNHFERLHFGRHGPVR